MSRNEVILVGMGRYHANCQNFLKSDFYLLFQTVSIGWESFGLIVLLGWEQQQKNQCLEKVEEQIFSESWEALQEE